MSSSRARGYGGYHGRTPFWKIVLATVLAAVILASGGLLFIQRSMGFDSYGRPYFPQAPEENPDGTGGQEAIPDLDFGVPEEEGQSVEAGDAADGQTQAVEPAAPVQGPEVLWGNLRAYRINALPLSNAIYWDANAIVKDGGYNAVAVTLKDESGTVYFPAQAAIAGAVRVNGDTGEALSTLTASGQYTIARLCCFLDPLTSNSDVGRYGLKNTGTYIFFDEYAQNWTDPAKIDARLYLYDLAREAADMGFDEILLSYVGYPTVGKLDKIAYGDTPIGDNLSTFLRGMREALEGTDVKLSVEVPRVLLNGEGDASGLTLDILAPWVDRVYASVESWEIGAMETAVRSAGEGRMAFVPELLGIPDPVPDRFMKIAR